MKAILDNVIIKPCESDNVSEGGIIVPDSFKERPSKAVVISAGVKASQFKEGDIVFHVKSAGVEIEKDGERYFIIKGMDILSVLN
jgi:chaperonin GroES